jgi:hypothetical protein
MRAADTAWRQRKMTVFGKDQKYRNRKTILDGILFDSRKEANRYAELKLMEKAGRIWDLQRQVPFQLLPAQRDQITGKVVEKAVVYKADFVYMTESGPVCEDVKGYKGGAGYGVFTIKRKLMLYVHGIRVREV